MDTLCGIGLPELIILALLGFVVIGPQRSQEVALKTGRFLRQVMTSAWWREFNQVAQAIRDLPTTLVRMAEIEETQTQLRQAVSEIEEVASIGIDQKPVPGGRPEIIATDPWGIANAAARTRITPRTPPADPAPPAPSPPAAPDESPDA